MRRKDTIEVRQRATLWAIYEAENDGITLVRKEVLVRGKPKMCGGQVAITIAKGHVVYTMAYDDFVKNATKSDFIKEEAVYGN